MQPGIEILLVDDSPNDIFVMQMALEELAFNAISHSTSNGADALKFLSAHPVDIIITDLNMPVMNGLKLVEALKSSELKRIPVIFLTASNSQDDINEAYRIGCACYIRKPLDKIELRHLIKFIDNWVRTVQLPGRIQKGSNG